jgi:hypothetical protein
MKEIIMVKKTVTRFKNPLEALGLPSLPKLPDPEEIREHLSHVSEIVDAAKEVPSGLIDRFKEADGTFRDAQRTFGHARIHDK